VVGSVFGMSSYLVFWAVSLAAVDVGLLSMYTDFCGLDHVSWW
jgi:hypothetical protein